MLFTQYFCLHRNKQAIVAV